MPQSIATSNLLSSAGEELPSRLSRVQAFEILSEVSKELNLLSCEKWSGGNSFLMFDLEALLANGLSKLIYNTRKGFFTLSQTATVYNNDWRGKALVMEGHRWIFTFDSEACHAQVKHGFGRVTLEHLSRHYGEDDNDDNNVPF